MLEMTGCHAGLLDDAEAISKFMIEAAKKANATVLGHSFHKFSPQGVSGVVVIAESHLSIHTWPEFEYAAVDVFTCGDRAMPQQAAEWLIEAFSPARHELREIPRGIPGQPDTEHTEEDMPVPRMNWRPPVYGGTA